MKPEKEKTYEFTVTAKKTKFKVRVRAESAATACNKLLNVIDTSRKGRVSEAKIIED